jgi:flagellar assembly factor FliW
MIVQTTRFGAVGIQAEDMLLFPSGLIGFEDCRHWVLLADRDSDAVGWLQNTARADVALAVVSPRRFAPEYKVRVAKEYVAGLQFAEIDQAFVLAIVSKNDGRLTINLKAPVIINLDRRLGRQVITSDDQPLQFALTGDPIPLRKSA